MLLESTATIAGQESPGDLPIGRRVVIPDQMKIARGIGDHAGVYGEARGPGHPLDGRPGDSAVRALFMIDLKVSRRVVVPDDVQMSARIQGDVRVQ